MLPSLSKEVVAPLLVGDRRRFDLPGLESRYRLGPDATFEVPVADECVVTSVTLGDASASAQAVSKRGRQLPPFPASNPMLKVAYNCFEEQFRNAAQQLRVAVHAAYIGSLQCKVLDQVGGPESSGTLSLARQLTDAQSHVAKDSIRSASSQIMSAVMGLRRVWLSLSKWAPATQTRLLALPFSLGGTLFPGAQAVVREAAEQVVSFKDSRVLLENKPAPRNRPSVLQASHPPVAAKGVASWAQQPLKAKRQRNRAKGKGKGKAPAASGQQQPFRSQGKPSAPRS